MINNKPLRKYIDNYFGDYSDGDATLSTATLSTTKFYRDVTLTAGETLTPTCYVIFARNFTINGTITANGNAGTSATCNISLRVNNLTTGIYSRLSLVQDASALVSVAQQNQTLAELNGNNILGSQTNTVIVDINDYANTTSYKQLNAQLSYQDSGTSTMENTTTIANMNMIAAINRIDIILSTGTFNAGTYILYGVN